MIIGTSRELNCLSSLAHAIKFKKVVYKKRSQVLSLMRIIYYTITKVFNYKKKFI